MKVAVLVPAYNVESYLAQCLDSLLAQSIPVDIFCCDDGSSDGTGRILDDYAARSPRVHAFHQRNKGMSANYNRLLDELPLEFEGFGIVDADDYVHPQMFETLALALERAQADVAECGMTPVGPTSVQPEGLPSVDPQAQDVVIDDMSVYWLKRTSPGAWINKCNKLYLRRSVEGLRFRIGLDFEDDIFFAREVNAVIRRKVIVPHVFYAYRQNPNSLNGNLDFRKYFSSTALRIQLSLDVFVATGRVPAPLRCEYARELAKDAYRMVIRKNLKKNRNPSERRELFMAAAAFFRTLERERNFRPFGLNPVQRGVYACCRRGWYGLARLLVAMA